MRCVKIIKYKELISSLMTLLVCDIFPSNFRKVFTYAPAMLIAFSGFTFKFISIVIAIHLTQNGQITK